MEKTQLKGDSELNTCIHDQNESRALSASGEKCWVNWRFEIQEDGKQTKVPCMPNGEKAKINDSSTWNTFDEVIAVQDRFNGIGIVFTGSLLGVDIDHCIVDGNVSPEITAFVEKAKTYTEVSPSETGLHLYLKLTEPMVLERKRSPHNGSGNYECYTTDRYFTVTSRPWTVSHPLRTVTPEEATNILRLIGYPWKTETSVPTHTISKEMVSLDNEALLKKMFSSKKGTKIEALYNGDTSAFGGDDSAADASLCSHLAFWTGGDVSRVESMWLASPLGNRSKTQERGDYRERTVAFALQSQNKHAMVDDFPLEISENEDKNFKKAFLKDSKGISYEIAKYLVEKHHVKTIGEKIRELYLYKNGVYILGLNYLKAEIQEILEELASTHHKTNIIEMIKDLTLADRKDFNVDKDLINFNNGIFNIKNKELIPHSHEYLFFTKIPIDYDAGATCSTVERFLKDILPEDDIKIILEWLGYCLFRCYFIKKAIIFVGEKDTGKTTLIKLFERFIGKENTSGVSLQKIASDKFASSHFYNKHINIYDDLSFKDINDNGAFKMVTGGGIISGEKKFGEQFQFENFSKLTFACNKIPDVKDTSDDAYFSRWIVIPFLAEIEKVDKLLTEKITTKEELSGLLNLAISGLRDILEKQDFSYNKNPEEIKKEMLLSGSMVANFVNDRLEKQVDAWVSKDDMYEECAKYAQSNNLPTVSKEILGRKLPNHSGYIIDGTKLIGGKKQVQGWRNAKIKGKEEKEG